jgi:phage gpG-like protein
MKDPANVIKDDMNSINKGLDNSLAKVGEEMVNSFKQNMSKQGIRIRTGRLQNSIRVDSIDNKGVSVVSDVDYADYVDEGTEKMIARPFFIETKELTDKIDKIIDNSITNVFK